MIRRLLVASSLAVAVTGIVATPASAATCVFAVAADLPPAGPGGGDFSFVVPASVPPGFVGPYQAAVSSFISALSSSLPAGSRVAVVNVCFP